jgi:tetratricopeptide (TPR) repeat protein
VREAAIAVVVTLLVGAATFLLGFKDGSYQLTDRSAIGIVAWWALAVGMAFKLWPAARVPRAAIVAGAALAALAILSVLSTGWAVSDEKAFLEFTRVLTYLGVLAVVAVAVRARHAAAVSDGLALGIVGVVGVALASRFWWGDFGPGAPPSFFPVQTRLHYPVNYWNGLAILAAMALPLLLRAAVAQRPPILRALALAPVPAIAATIYLTSSRGGAAVAAVGVLVFCALTSRRTSALVATAIGSAGAIAAIEVLLARDDLVNGPLSAPAVAGQGHSAALLIAVLAAGCVAVYWAWCRFADWDVRLPRPVQAALVGAMALVALIGVAAFDPAGKFEDFKRPPAETKYVEGDFTRSHLLSSTSTGRWQLWAAAGDQWETKPALGQGAGSYQSWWTEHADFPLFVRDAHNLWLEMLGELGVAGFALILLVFGAGLVAAVSRLRRAGPARPLVAALTAVLAAFMLGAAIDWMWELTIVALVAVVALGMLVGAATLPPDGQRQAPQAFSGARGDVRVRALRTAAVAVALAALMCVTVPMFAQQRLEESQAAADAGDVAKAVDSAEDARSLEPWAASPYVQLALVSEQAGDLHRANRHIKDALERDSRDWSTWLVAARIQTKAGSIRAGRRSLRRAEALNPTSQVFEDLRDRASR